VIDGELAVAHAHERQVGDRLELEPDQERQLDEILAELVAAAERESELLAA
jgi:hypothetical protein